ncbi:MAG: BMP family ABC transporter substrate-binding protein [Treponema sp.]|jgi:basic membrane protein A|nr:BMP family ABC transporter substrate-binding protein [Treponema sp.]
MKRKLLFMVTALILAAVSGCNKGGSATGGGGDGKTFKVALVVNQKFGDNGPMDDLASGAEKAARDFAGVSIKKLESESASKFEEDVRAMSKDYDLIVTTFPYMTDATKLVSREFPNKKYAAVFQFINVDGARLDNIWDTEFHGEQAFYIAGYMAGLLTKTNRVGMIIGGEEPTPNAEGNGFMRGVRAANPKAAVEFSFIGSYEDPAKAKEIANAMIAKGCDFLQTDSGASNAGVVEAAKEKNIPCSGEITDFYDSYNGFIGRVGIGFGDTVYKAIETLAQGSYPGGVHGIRDLTNGGYFMDWDSYQRYAGKNPAFTPVIEAGKKAEEQIKSGEVKVAFDTRVPNWSRIGQE